MEVFSTVCTSTVQAPRVCHEKKSGSLSAGFSEYASYISWVRQRHPGAQRLAETQTWRRYGPGGEAALVAAAAAAPGGLCCPSDQQLKVRDGAAFDILTGRVVSQKKCRSSVSAVLLPPPRQLPVFLEPQNQPIPMHLPRLDCELVVYPDSYSSSYEQLRSSAGGGGAGPGVLWLRYWARAAVPLHRCRARRCLRCGGASGVKRDSQHAVADSNKVKVLRAAHADAYGAKLLLE